MTVLKNDRILLLVSNFHIAQANLLPTTALVFVEKQPVFCYPKNKQVKVPQWRDTPFLYTQKNALPIKDNNNNTVLTKGGGAAANTTTTTMYYYKKNREKHDESR